MKKIKMVILTTILIIILSGTVYASDKMYFMNKSDAFEAWEQLSEEERKSVIQPNFISINYQDSIKRSKYNQGLKLNSIEEKFSLKNNIDIIVKNQRKTGSCWAFSYTSILETTMANKYKKQNEYSPMHIEYKTIDMFNKGFEGGNKWLSLAYSNSGHGPVSEHDFPMEAVYNEEENSAENYYLKDIENLELNLDLDTNVIVEDATFFPSICKTIDDGKMTYKDSSTLFGGTKYTEQEVKAIRNSIKEHIKQNGAVVAAMYSDLGIMNGKMYSDYFNTEKNAYYCDTTSVPNHSVTIVGWDDTYSKNNFNSAHRPINDGAYIILNSYGEEYLNNGYMYVSYDDVHIEEDITGISKIGEYLKDINKIYQHDELGMSEGLYFINDQGTEYLPSGYMANIFTRENSNGAEYLNEVGIYLAETEGIEIYINPSSDDKNKLIKVASYIGESALEAGYHKVPLPSSIKLTGSKYVVAVKYINGERTSAPVECNLRDCGITGASNYFDKVKSSEGESFISKDGNTWSDLYNYRHGEYTLKNTNACIKAFTTETEKYEAIPVKGIELNKTTYKMKVGDEGNLIATIKPEYATNRNVKWTSSNEKVATISETGVIKALSAGTSTIKVITEDGNYEATCKLTVEEKTNSSDDIYRPGGTTNRTPVNTTIVNNSKTYQSDYTTAPKTLPRTGSKIIIIIIICASIFVIIGYMKYRSYDDIK